MAIDQKTAIQSGKQLASLVRAKIDSDALVLLFGSCVKNKTHDRSDHAFSISNWEYATPFINEIKKTGVALSESSKKLLDYTSFVMYNFIIGR